MKIKGITFDLEGTIIDVELAHHLGHLEAAKELGLRLSLEEARASIPSFVGGPDINIAKELKEMSNSDSTIEEISGRMKLHYQSFRSRMKIEPRNGFASCFQSLKSRGFQVALGSSTCRAIGLELMKTAGLTHFFNPENILFYEDVIKSKPFPDVYVETAARMNISPGNQLIFEDSPVGVEAGFRAGSQVIAVPVIHSDAFLGRLVSSGAKRVFAEWYQVELDDIL